MLRDFSISNEIEYNPNSWAEEIDGSGLDRPTSAKTVKRPCLHPTIGYLFTPVTPTSNWVA